MSRDEANGILGAKLRPAMALGHWIAAVRALFESSGILLGIADITTQQAWNQLASRLNARRLQLLAGTIGFRALLEAEGLVCDLTPLNYFSHWLDDAEPGKLFHVRFFLCHCPKFHEPSLTAICKNGFWATPDRALADYSRGNFDLTFPVFASLRTLADFDSWESLCDEYNL